MGVQNRCLSDFQLNSRIVHHHPHSAIGVPRRIVAAEKTEMDSGGSVNRDDGRIIQGEKLDRRPGSKPQLSVWNRF